MAKISTSYEAADGKKFPTEIDADAHDLTLSMADDISSFTALRGLGKADATRAVRHITGFAAFMKAKPASTEPAAA